MDHHVPVSPVSLCLSGSINFSRFVKAGRRWGIISLDTHPAFSHTLPLKIIGTNRIQKSNGKPFTSPAAAG
jgi:hypothetical protein